MKDNYRREVFEESTIMEYREYGNAGQEYDDLDTRDPKNKQFSISHDFGSVSSINSAVLTL